MLGLFVKFLLIGFITSLFEVSKKIYKTKAFHTKHYNTPAHSEAASLMSYNSCIKAIFLPPSTTALIQPMDQGVLEALKRRYSRCLLHKFLLEDEDRQSVIEYAKSINLKHVVYMVDSAWDDIPASNFKNHGIH